MNIEEAKAMLPIIKAFTEGEEIEIFSNADKEWTVCTDPSFSLKPQYYRIKAKPHYRPFKDKAECWETMLYHKPFGWVVEKEKWESFHINSIGKTGVGGYTYRKAFEELVFADGTPFGIAEEVVKFHNYGDKHA